MVATTNLPTKILPAACSSLSTGLQLEVDVIDLLLLTGMSGSESRSASGAPGCGTWNWPGWSLEVRRLTIAKQGGAEKDKAAAIRYSVPQL